MSVKCVNGYIIKLFRFPLTKNPLFCRLNKLQQYAAGGGRMNEGDETALGTDPRCLVDQTHALCLKFCQRSLNIIDLNRDVMYSAAAFFEELADRRVVARRFEQLHAALAQRQHRNADLLVLNGLGMDIFEPESVAPEFERFVDAFCRDA